MGRWGDKEIIIKIITYYLFPIPMPNFLFPIYISSEASEVFDGENSLARALATNVQPAFNSF